MVIVDPGGNFARQLQIKVINVLAFLEKFADTAVFPGIESVAAQASLKAAEQTPKDRDPRDVDDPPFSPQISESWTVTSDKTKRRATVQNIHPRSDVVGILEFGSPPHFIPAKPGKPLRFTDRGLVDRVEPFGVRHPGHRPFGMIAGATALANVEMTALTERLKVLIDET